METAVSTDFDAETNKNVTRWLAGCYDESTKSQIRTLLKTNPKEIIDAFYTTLSFGTGGLRGVMGIGSNRINKYTIGAAAQGLANYINQQTSRELRKAVMVGYDSRRHSREFAEECAKILAANGIKAYLLCDIRPVPLVSFSIRLKKCIAGIMITASHNPPAYNGFKVYWSDGGQVLAPHDQNIVSEVGKITDNGMIRRLPSLHDPLIAQAGEEIDDAYLEINSRLQNYPKDNRRYGPELKVVYTSLHGTGIALMPKILDDWGFTNLNFVEKQVVPDGDFPTVAYPNPEEVSALKMGVECLKEHLGDILIATDPDADRLGVAANLNGKIDYFTGNEVACILLDHVCNALTANKKMPPNAGFVKTIVTTELFKAIAESYGKPCFNVLTGFKHIARKIKEWEEEPHGYQFVFGGEESCGYLLGTQTRDKDAILSAALVCETALHAKRKQKTLRDLLYDLYKKHGVHFDTLHTLHFEEGKKGKEALFQAMENLRLSRPRQIGGHAVLFIEDYSNSTRSDLLEGTSTLLRYPRSNVLLFQLEGAAKLVVRPSGTEPKLKIYCGVVDKNTDSIEQTLKTCKAKAEQLIAAMVELLQKN